MARPTSEEVARSIVKAKDDKPSEIESEDRECVAYGKRAVEVTEKSKDALAKAVRYGESITYYILRGPNNKPFNPYDLSYDDNHRYRHQFGERNSYQWRETTKRIFDFYLKFLETQNRSYLLNAEREE